MRLLIVVVEVAGPVLLFLNDAVDVLKVILVELINYENDTDTTTIFT